MHLHGRFGGYLMIGRENLPKANVEVFPTHGNARGATAGMKCDLCYDLRSQEVVKRPSPATFFSFSFYERPPLVSPLRSMHKLTVRINRAWNHIPAGEGLARHRIFPDCDYRLGRAYDELLTPLLLQPLHSGYPSK